MTIAKEEELARSEWWAKNIKPLVQKVAQEGGQPEFLYNDYTVQWVCPVCETTDLWMNFEEGICDKCFKVLLDKWVTEPKSFQ